MRCSRKLVSQWVSPSFGMGKGGALEHRLKLKLKPLIKMGVGLGSEEVMVPLLNDLSWGPALYSRPQEVRVPFLGDF